MTNDDFLALVRDMRQAQKAYFAKRKYEDLERSRTLERAVDKALKEIADGQQSLFD